MGEILNRTANQLADNTPVRLYISLYLPLQTVSQN